MLVLARKESESIQIGPSVNVTVVRTGKHSVRLGIEAPKGWPIVRTESSWGQDYLRQLAGDLPPRKTLMIDPPVEVIR